VSIASLILVINLHTLDRAKYPLAVTNKLLEVFGPSLVLGYDIGCGFAGTLTRTSLAGAVAESALRMAVPLFHGHAHNRLCQLSYLPLYIQGLGLEDLEGCERAFSKSNEVSKTTRYSSRFHRQQAIVTHFQQWDREKYTELCKSSVAQKFPS
jgi:Kyakuja-Dileera-Zisupton transposase